MSNPKGNPEFGSKYRFDYGRDEPLTEQVKAVVRPVVKETLKNLAAKNNCTVPDLVRAAIDEYLAGTLIDKAS